MDTPIGTSTLRPWDDSPGYDLISLGLVALVVLLIGVWLTHFFRQPPAGFEDYETKRAQLFQDKSFTTGDGQLTSEGHLILAQWIDFNLRSADGDTIAPQFRENLAAALKKERVSREALQRARAHDPDARLTLADEPAPPALSWAKTWVAKQSERLDQTRAGASARLELAKLCDELELKEEAAREREKVRSVRPDHPGLR